MQSILDHIIDGHNYEFLSIADSSLSIENDKLSKVLGDNTLDTIDNLLTALNEPNYSIETNKTNNDSFTALITAAESCLNDENSSLNSQSFP